MKRVAILASIVTFAIPSLVIAGEAGKMTDPCWNNTCLTVPAQEVLPKAEHPRVERGYPWFSKPMPNPAWPDLTGDFCRNDSCLKAPTSEIFPAAEQPRVREGYPWR